jgi:hypothetical protein
VQDLFNETRARPWFAVFLLGALVTTAAAALAAPQLGRLGAVLLLAATIAIGGELLRAQRGAPSRPASSGLSSPLHHREQIEMSDQSYATLDVHLIRRAGVR